MEKPISVLSDYLIPLENEPDLKGLPEKMNNPFYYEPHPLCLKAKSYLEKQILPQTHKAHHFGVDGHLGGLGKMIGILIVLYDSAKVGFLCAFSGKLDSGYHLKPFVPPIVDLSDNSGYYVQEERAISEINNQIQMLQESSERVSLINKISDLEELMNLEITQLKSKIADSKQKRQLLRLQICSSGDLTARADRLHQLDLESKSEQLALKSLKKSWKNAILKAREQLQIIERPIELLKEERLQKSKQLQHWIFEQYQFLNAKGQSKSLKDIFKLHQDELPPSGVGECTAPKLLQFAFAHGLIPLAISEFWYGKNPPGELRNHGSFYPACKSRCEPILQHMLAGLDVMPNPITSSQPPLQMPEILYEDEHLIAVNKPAGILSVPGKTQQLTIIDLIKLYRVDANHWQTIHRLDMATSGILLIAKDESILSDMQLLFANGQIHKVYEALLDGHLTRDSGLIDLPLRVNLEDRPRQMVCYHYGKPAKTYWKVKSHEKNLTRVWFYPKTGRTHQLRVHSAYIHGLGIPILGDDLYGKKADRLYLHSSTLEFVHPRSGKKIKIRSKTPF